MVTPQEPQTPESTLGFCAASETEAGTRSCTWLDAIRDSNRSGGIIIRPLAKRLWVNICICIRG
jgi:hypothetical protein